MTFLLDLGGEREEEATFEGVILRSGFRGFFSLEPNMNRDVVNGKVPPTRPCLSLESPNSYSAGSFSLPFLVS